MKKVLFILLSLLPLLAMGQTSSAHKSKPFWLNGYHKDGSNSYLEVVSGFGYDLPQARNNSAKEVIGRRSLATGTDAKVSIQGQDINIISNHNVIVKSRIIDEYIEHTSNGYTVYQLVQTAKNPSFDFENVELTNKYKFSPIAFVPGMAQIHKGSAVKGGIIITAQVASIAGIVVCENMRASYHKKAIEQTKFAKEYTSKARDWSVGRNIAIGAAACIYVYNFIDAVVAKGKMGAVMSNDRGSALSLMPIITEESSGLALTYSF